MNDEVESRYIVPDRLLVARLAALRALGAYTLKPRGETRTTDEYLDSQGRALTRQGWACRLRHDGMRWLATLKGPRTGEGAVHTRPEIEITLPGAIRDYAQWPQGELRDRVGELCGGSPLGTLLVIRQRRRALTVLDGDRVVATLSLDRVRCQGRGLHHQSYMLECELEPDGALDDLHRLDALLVADYDLLPEPRSKLRRALELIERGGLPEIDLRERLRPVTSRELLARYGADLAEAEAVARLALQLYDGLQTAHGLDEGARGLVETAALLTALSGVALQQPGHLVARDLALRHRLVGLCDEDEQVVAAALFLQRQAVSPDRIVEALPGTFGAEMRRRALAVAALVRLAVAIGRQPQVSIADIRPVDGAMRILLAGAGNEQAASRASRRGDLWAMLHAARLEWGLLSADGDVVLSASAGQKLLGLNPWDAMPTAARKVLGYWYRQMRAHEAGTRLGEDPEELHDMRVATRRMRSALGLFRGYLSGAAVARCNERLRRAGNVLGAVRDLDVAIARAETFAADHDTVDLEPLLRRWRRQRDRARQALVRYLDGREYTRFQQSMAELLASLAVEDAWAEGAQAVGQLAPKMLYVQNAVVASYDAVLADAPVQMLHALRIDAKRLRYGLEFFREVLPDEVQALIPAVVRLQDHLGELHDQHVAAMMIDDTLRGHERSRSSAGALAYREACVVRQETLAGSFAEVWGAFRAQRSRRLLRRLVSGKGAA